MASRPSALRWQRTRGVSLLEVLAALALLGTLLGTLLLARARYLQQWTLAGEKLEALRAADMWLEQHWHSATGLKGIPRAGAGEWGDNLRWQTTTRPVEQLAAVEAERVELMVFRKGTSDSPERMLARVELIVPHEEKP